MAMRRAGLLGRHYASPFRLLCRQASLHASPRRCFYCSRRPFSLVSDQCFFVFDLSPVVSILARILVILSFVSPRALGRSSFALRFVFDLALRFRFLIGYLSSRLSSCPPPSFALHFVFDRALWFWILSGIFLLASILESDISTEPQAAVDRLKESGLLKTQGLIGGKWIDAYDGKTIQVQNPATGDVITSVPCMGRNETTSAISSAYNTFSSWSKLTASERSKCLRK
ncbi:hypothetical protein GW17_00019490 [Ensete ventricosum]|nr:hypothetical protein GW17_00019490 [Ensete ventricosum]